MSDILLSLQALAREVASQLHRTGTRVVFAESCTAGWCSALLSVVPGISAFLCGSLVTYQNESKAAWLHVSPADLDCPEIGPVSETVARQMCMGALSCTPHARLAMSVTGHLGPNAPPPLDGVVYVGSAFRSVTDTTPSVSVERYQFTAEGTDGVTIRLRRQQQAIEAVYRLLLKQLS